VNSRERILWIDVDTLRADRLGCYGCAVNTSPNLDRLAREGALFTRAFTSNAPCVPARAAMISGRCGVANGIVTHPGPGAWLNDAAFGAQGERLMTRPLQARGLHTCSISSFYKHDHGRETGWFRYAFDESHDPAYDRRCQRDHSEQVNGIALPWLERHRDSDFLLHLHYWDPHTPYDLPDAVHRPFLANPPWPYPTEAMKREHLSRFHAQGPQRFGFKTVAEIDTFLNRYDAQIHHTDRHIGQVLDKLAALGILDETLIVVTSDHGEQFGEQGMYGEHAAAVTPNLRVPLILHLPGRIPAGMRSDALVYAQDMVPTLWEHAGAAPNPTDFASLWPLLSGHAASVHPFLICDHGLYTSTRAVFEDRFKLMLTYSPGYFGYGMYPPVALYDLAADPHEETDVLDRHPDVARRLYGRVEDWLRGHGHDAHGDPMQRLANVGPRTYDFPEIFMRQELAARGVRGRDGHP
jgi:arylsulfatase A-like enzyme